MKILGDSSGLTKLGSPRAYCSLNNLPFQAHVIWHRFVSIEHVNLIGLAPFRIDLWLKIEVMVEVFIKLVLLGVE